MNGGGGRFRIDSRHEPALLFFRVLLLECPFLSTIHPVSFVKCVQVICRRYLLDLHKHTNRNVIAYYSGFLTKPGIQGIEINDEDKNGFMSCVHQMDREKGLDLLLHTGGSSAAAAESLVHYLKQMFGSSIRAIVPQIAMSAGTVLACACKSILMGKHSSIGPVDPQINGIPCVGVVEEVKKAFSEIIEDQRAALVWNPILGRLVPSFLQQCEWAIESSKKFLKEALENGMLRDLPIENRDVAVRRVTDRLTDLNYNKSHDRHIHCEECAKIGLKVEMLEDPNESALQDKVLTVHHCFMHTLANTQAFKIIENHRGRSFIKLQQQQASGGLNVQLPVGM